MNEMVLETHVGTHGTIKIEVEQPAEGLREAGAVERAAQIARDAFDEGLQSVRVLAKGVADHLAQLDDTQRPQKVEVEFGLKLSSEAGAFLAKATAEGQLTVTLTWEPR